MKNNIARAAVAVGLLGLTGMIAVADEGMWLLTNLPREQLNSRYGFDPDPAWLMHMQRSAVRFSGASGSLVSGHGLVMTNHHVGRSAIGKLSTAQRDLVKDGFYAPTREQELPAPDLELNVLWSIEDVTAKVNASTRPGMSTPEANAARREAMARIEQESEEQTGLLSQVVTLYNGGQYHLYSYKRYTDVRLVFAPEQQAASFGGDIDNFEYPRFCADFSFFRIYEDGKPLENKDFLRWSNAGGQAGELAMIFGHPGRTSRLDTVADLEFTRDLATPLRLASLQKREIELQSFMGRSAEQHRIGATDIKGVANGRKALTGMLQGLLDPQLMRRKQQDEQALQASSEGSGSAGDPWERIAGAMDAYRTFYARRAAIDGLFRSALSSRAMMLVRMSQELPKPSGERFREYRDTALPQLERRLYSPAPIYDSLEVDRLTSALMGLAWALGADDPLVKTAFGGRSPARRAQELVSGTRLGDIAKRRTLAQGGATAIRESGDPMMLLARALEPESRALRVRYEDEVQAVERPAYAQIAAARFKLYGDKVYPDATSTLRMTFGAIDGWEEGGRTIKPFTTISGMFERAALRAGEPEFVLPDSWRDAKGRLNLDTPMNFVCKGDVIGGNSGSPIVNRDGQVIGVVFDGNLHMLVGRYAYDETTNRTVAVDARLIIEALSKVYGATALVDEILQRGVR